MEVSPIMKQERTTELQWAIGYDKGSNNGIIENNKQKVVQSLAAVTAATMLDTGQHGSNEVNNEMNDVESQQENDNPEVSDFGAQNLTPQPHSPENQIVEGAESISALGSLLLSTSSSMSSERYLALQPHDSVDIFAAFSSLQGTQDAMNVDGSENLAESFEDKRKKLHKSTYDEALEQTLHRMIERGMGGRCLMASP